MGKQEKECARCKGLFECSSVNISECHCFNIPLDADEKIYIATKYTDCLCAACLGALQEEYRFITVNNLKKPC